MRTFVMGDLHGAWKALRQCLERAAFDRHEDRLIQPGDVADGYDQVFECVEELLSLDHLVAIRGIHDAWFLEYLRTGNHPDRWRQGGYGTLQSYLRPLGRAGELTRTLSRYLTTLIPGDIPEAHRGFFTRQRLHYVDEENNCFVHAGYNRYLPFFTQHEEVYFWDRRL